MRSTQSTSKTTCSARTSPTDRATVMMGSGHSGGRFRPTNRIGGSYTGPGFPVTVSPRPAGAPHTGDQRHASSGWGEAPLDIASDVGEHAVRIGPQVDAVRVEHAQQVVRGHRTAHRKNLPDNSSDRPPGSASHGPDAPRPHGAILTVHPVSRRMRSLPRSDGLRADSQLRPNDSQFRARHWG